MATLDSVKTKLSNLISRANATTGKSDTTLTNAINTLIGGYLKGGITPSGTKSITANGTYDVTNFASASVNVPTGGITPSGTKTITTNGNHDVTAYATAAVNVPGLNAKIFSASIASDTTSGTVTLLAANEYIKSLKNNENAFILVRYLGVAASTAMNNFWFMANKPLHYNGATAHKTFSIRSTASAASFQGNVHGLSGEGNYNAHLNVDSNGRIYMYGNATYPIKAGAYQIIAGTFEMV